MMEIFWLEQIGADVPSADDWLSLKERARLNDLRFAKRRADWRLGRWAGKCAVAAYLKLPLDSCSLAEIEIRSAVSGAPQVFRADQPAAPAISLSHRDGVAICAVAPSSVALGCDLELVEPHSDGFIGDYLTNGEQALIERASPEERFRLVALLWSAKESALKALGEGLRLDTRCVTVTPKQSADTEGWRPLRVDYVQGQTLHGWWRFFGNMVRTMVASPQPASPVALELPLSSRHVVPVITEVTHYSIYR